MLLEIVDDVRYHPPNLEQVFIENKNLFSRFNGRKNNCSNTVALFLSKIGIDDDKITPFADTVRNVGPVIYDPKQLKKGDIVAMGRPGDTWHVGVYFGEGRVLHQSAVRGYKVGIFNDISAFTNHHRGFYIVRPYSNILEEQLFVAPSII